MYSEDPFLVLLNKLGVMVHVNIRLLLKSRQTQVKSDSRVIAWLSVLQVRLVAFSSKMAGGNARDGRAVDTILEKRWISKHFCSLKPRHQEAKHAQTQLYDIIWLTNAMQHGIRRTARTQSIICTSSEVIRKSRVKVVLRWMHWVKQTIPEGSSCGLGLCGYAESGGVLNKSNSR